MIPRPAFAQHPRLNKIGDYSRYGMHFCMSEHKNPTLSDWAHARAFLAAAETGSLSAAARRLGLTQPTLGRQIDRLEQGLRVALFLRASRGLVLTEAGARLLPDAQAMAAAAEAMARSASDVTDPGKGVVRITTSEIVGGAVLPPRLAPLMRAYPNLTLELVATNSAQDLLRRDADIAVRMVRPVQAALVARRIGQVELGLFGAASYFAHRPAPQDVADLTDHALIGFDRDDGGARSIGANWATFADRFRYRTDSDLAQLAALRAGLGLGVCHVPLAGADATLHRVLPDLARFELEMWVVTHESLRDNPRVRLVFNHLVSTLSDYVATA